MEPSRNKKHMESRRSVDSSWVSMSFCLHEFLHTTLLLNEVPDAPNAWLTANYLALYKVVVVFPLYKWPSTSLVPSPSISYSGWFIVRESDYCITEIEPAYRNVDSRIKTALQIKPKTQFFYNCRVVMQRMAKR